MVDEFSIIVANLNDLLSMADLLKVLFMIEDDFVIDRQKQIHGLQLLLEQSNTTILIAQHHNRLVGMVSMQQLISTAMGERVGLIEDMIVQSDFRGQGIGSLLLTSLITVSKQLGYKLLTLGVDLLNTPAKAFYTRFGFQTSNMGLMYKI